jgi:hypothetical protein
MPHDRETGAMPPMLRAVPGQAIELYPNLPARAAGGDLLACCAEIEELHRIAAIYEVVPGLPDEQIDALTSRFNQVLSVVSALPARSPAELHAKARATLCALDDCVCWGEQLDHEHLLEPAEAHELLSRSLARDVVAAGGDAVRLPGRRLAEREPG